MVYTHSKSFVDLLAVPHPETKWSHQTKLHFLPLASCSRRCETFHVQLLISQRRLTGPGPKCWYPPEECLNKVDPSFPQKVKIEETYIDNILIVWCWDLFPELTSYLPGWSFVLQAFSGKFAGERRLMNQKIKRVDNQMRFLSLDAATWKTSRTVESKQWKVIR